MSDDTLEQRARDWWVTQMDCSPIGLENLAEFARQEVQRERERWAKIAADLVDENKRLIDRIGELL